MKIKIHRALILGATSDMAKSFINLLAKNGVSLILVARNKEKLDSLTKDLKIRYQVEIDQIYFDVEKEEENIEKFIKKINKEFDLFACFIGYLGEQKKAQESIEEAKKIIKINYQMPALITEKIVDLMQRSSFQHKTIIGVSSVAGDRGRQSNYFYGSAKSAYSAYLSGLRNRLSKQGIHVITVKPGFVFTSMTETMKLPKLLTAMPDEVAEDMLKAVYKRTNVLYTKWFWKYIMLIIRLIPESIFKKLSL